MNHNLEFNKGQALLVIIIFLSITLIFGFITVSNTLHFNRIINIIDRDAIAKEAAEAGIAKAIWCLNQTSGEKCGGTYGSDYVGESDVFIGQASFTTTVTNEDPTTKLITSIGYYPNATSTQAKVILKQEAGIDTETVNFYFALQSGQGGFNMSNTATVHGNVYSNGNIKGANQAKIEGDVWVANGGGSQNTYIDGMHITGNAHANTILNSTIDGSSFSKTISNSTIGGNLLSSTSTYVTVKESASSTYIANSTIGGNVYCKVFSNINVGGKTFCPVDIVPPDDPLPAEMPISDKTIEKWKADASAGELISGSISRSSGELVIGPAKITGNLTLSNTAVLRMTGTIYVQGNLSLSNGATIYLDPSYGSLSGVIVVDGKISVTNSITLNGSGVKGSVLMIVTTNTASDAVNISNSANAGIFYAPYGGADLSNKTSIKELTANTITMQNQAEIWYEKGLANSNFTSGPGGGWVLKEGTWRVIK